MPKPKITIPPATLARVRKANDDYRRAEIKERGDKPVKRTKPKGKAK